MNGSSDFKPLQTVLGKRKATEATTGNTGNQKADAGISEDDVDIVMVEASPVDQPTGAHPNDVEAAQDSSAAASAGATSEQGMQVRTLLHRDFPIAGACRGVMSWIV